MNSSVVCREDSFESFVDKDCYAGRKESVKRVSVLLSQLSDCCNLYFSSREYNTLTVLNSHDDEMCSLLDSQKRKMPIVVEMAMSQASALSNFMLVKGDHAHAAVLKEAFDVAMMDLENVFISLHKIQLGHVYLMQKSASEANEVASSGFYELDSKITSYIAELSSMGDMVWD